ncbi:DUF2125 domain-containing protein [Rhodobacter sp. SY28-1]|uniref:DUF2125 domain-containing protein n=1 Tax=Rhodobacter sp. SY28-1 TaxID=2562317 RepID=UPI0010BFD295|nr:DUF2125 domain-containing protein [Rhodobacter sp. SY28-1]
MFRMNSFIAAPAIALLLSGTAHAALTADQVWQSWKDAGAMVGLTISAATENNSGGVLTLNGVSIAPEGVAGLTISDMTLTEQSDGSVAIVPGADIGVAMTGDTEGSVKLTHDGLTITAREADGGVAYDYAAAKLDVVYDSTYPGMSFDGSEAPKVSSSGDVSFANLSGTYSDTPGTNRTFGWSLKADTLAYTTNSDDPGMELKQTSTSTTQGIDLALSFALPTTIALTAIASPADFTTALNEGLAVTMSTKQGESSGTMKQESAFMPMDLVMKAGGGEGTAVFNKDTFSIKSMAAGLEIESAAGALPVPVKVTSGPLEFGLTSPVIATEAAGDYGFVLKLADFSINEEAWAMFDPNAALPRDAAQIAIDISGKTKMDLPALVAAEETGVPYVPALESLNITELGLKVAGAALAGTGAFTFDNSMGMPMPLGEANVTVTGANALIDGLIATGLMAEEDAMGARMMMGMFMVPGANADELTSKIEAKEGMQILVNGQPLPM